MQALDEKILGFINQHHVLSLATCINNQPWCCNCFYVFSKEDISFIVTSHFQTRHINEVLQNSAVAACIVLETKRVGKIQGLQITGSMISLEGEDLSTYKKKYLQHFPIAITFDTNYWKLNVEYMKMTDNRLLFGQKLIWQRE